MPAEFVHANWSLANLVLVITYIIFFSGAGECSLRGSSKNKSKLALCKYFKKRLFIKFSASCDGVNFTV